MTDISELIANIRAWEAADKALKELTGKEVPHSIYHKAYEQRGIAARRLADIRYYDDTLAAFVALADHAEVLQARIDAAMAIDVHPFVGDLGDGYPYGWDACREEFREVLTGESK